MYPPGWDLVASLVGLIWPNGDPSALRTAGDAWTAAGDTLVVPGIDRIYDAAAKVELLETPESPEASEACMQMKDYVWNLAQACFQMAVHSHEYATHIEQAHNEAIDELNSLLAFTAVTETIGLAAAFFSFGAAEVPAQGAVAIRLAKAASRIAEIIRGL